MHELRILNGLHRGATLPLLDANGRILGADEDADVVLADPGIAARHARISLGEGGWSLSALDGAVRDAVTNAPAASLELAFGDFARADHVWLTVVDENAGWSDPPAEPVDVPEAEAEEDAEPVMEAADEDADGPLFSGDDEQSDADDKPKTPIEQVDGAQILPGRRPRGYRMILVPLVAATALSAAAAYALTSRPAGPGEEIAAAEAAQLRRLAAQPQRLPQDQLQAALRKRLAQVDLLGRVTLELDEHEWTIRGALNDDDAERLRRMLSAFAKTYEIDFPVNVTMGNAESMLPFKITQVLSGNEPSIVTDDGRRLYVGDEYRGVRLAAVAGNQIRFTGKHALDVTW